MTIHSNPHSDNDLEMLSAYIDRQLPAAERAALERRLREEPALRSALEELRATVGLLRELEPLTPPRSFAIDASAVAPRRRWALNWPALSSALVALVCLFVFSWALIRSGSGSTGGGMAAAPQAPAGAAAAAPTAAPAAMEAPAAGGTAATAAESAPMMSAAAPTTAAAAAGAAAPPAAPMPAATMPPSSARLQVGTATPPATPAAPANSAPAQPQANDGALAAPTSLPYAAPSQSQADIAQPTATPEHPVSALVATSGISSPGTVDLAQPTIAPVASSAPAGGVNSVGLIAGAIGLLLLLGAGIAVLRRRIGR